MMPHLDRRQPHFGRQFANLERITGGQYHGVPASFQFPDDGFEEWNVRRVVQINPDFHQKGDSFCSRPKAGRLRPGQFAREAQTSKQN